VSSPPDHDVNHYTTEAVGRMCLKYPFNVTP